MLIKLEPTQNKYKSIGDSQTIDSLRENLIPNGKGSMKGNDMDRDYKAGITHYIDIQSMHLKNNLIGTGISVSKKGVHIVLNIPGNLTFETNRADIRPQLYRPLTAISTILQEYPRSRIVVEGHTDNIGNEYYNYQLSYNRAVSIRRYLTAMGVDPQRVEAIGRGETYPIANNDTIAGRQENRRIEIHIEGI